MDFRLNNVQAQLSAQELIELATPDKATLNKLSFSKLLDLSKYLMTDDVLKDIFGLVRPDIGEENELPQTVHHHHRKQ
jgi:hypothetical protein